VETESKIAKSTATYVLALSLFCLAGALIYFSLKVSEVTQSLPTILDSVEQASAKIEPVLEEVNEIRVLIPPILEEVKQTRLLVPPILEEVRKTREIIPPILEEVEQTRKQVPAILEEVAATRKQIPAIIKATDKTSDSVVTASQEIAATRKIIPDILDQVEKTREAIPPMLDKADQIVAEAKQAGKEASEGAVAGVFTGIIKAPIKMVGDFSKSVLGSMGKGVKGFSDDDREMITKLGNELLASGVKGDSRSWINPKNDNENTVSIVEEKTIKSRECKVLRVETSAGDKMLINKDMTACPVGESEWEVIE
jgi:archaellum component FlaC